MLKLNCSNKEINEVIQLNEKQVDLEKLKNAREKKGYSQEEMAKKMGWSARSKYTKREKGSVSISANELMKIITLLGYQEHKIHTFYK